MQSNLNTYMNRLVRETMNTAGVKYCYFLFFYIIALLLSLWRVGFSVISHRLCFRFTVCIHYLLFELQWRELDTSKQSWRSSRFKQMADGAIFDSWRHFGRFWDFGHQNENSGKSVAQQLHIPIHQCKRDLKTSCKREEWRRSASVMYSPLSSSRWRGRRPFSFHSQEP